jgi:hypothetical protein
MRIGFPSLNVSGAFAPENRAGVKPRSPVRWIEFIY